MAYSPNRMRILLSVAYLGFAAPANAEGIEPLDEYFRKNDFIHNPEVIQYVYLRCSSLYTFLSVAAQDDMEFKSKANLFRRESEEFLGALAETEHGASVARSELFALVGEYKNRFVSAGSAEKGLLSDRIIRSDFRMCSTVSENLRSQ